MSRSSRHSRSRVPTKRPANELARGAGTGWTEALGGIGLCLIVWWAADRARRWAPTNVSASLAERPAEHVATAHHRLWSSRRTIGDRSPIGLRVTGGWCLREDPMFLTGLGLARTEGDDCRRDHPSSRTSPTPPCHGSGCAGAGTSAFADVLVDGLRRRGPRR